MRNTQLITTDGVRLLQEELAFHQERLNKALQEKGEILKTESAVESFAYEQSVLKIDQITRSIDHIKSRLQNSTIVESTDFANGEACIGAKISLEIIFPGEQVPEEICLKLTDVPKYSGLDFISVNSPLGQAVVGQKEGHNFSYSVNGQEAKGKIIKIHPIAS